MPIRFPAMAICAVFAACAPLSASHMQAVYRCRSGHTIEAAYAGNTATVRYEGATRRMVVAVSGSGARYVGDGLEWWTKGTGRGSEGRLLRHLDDGSPGQVIEACIQATDTHDAQ